jgi:predicted ATPase
LEERERVAELNLIAGKRAKTATAYAAALTYFVAGSALLAEYSWERRYALTFALEFHRAECEFLTGDFAAAEERLLMLSSRAGDLVDSAAVTRLQTELYTALDRSDRAVEAGLDYLRRVGVDWSPHPTNDDVRQEYERIWRQLGSRTVEALVDLPLMTDPACRATLDVLTAVEEPAHFTDQNLRCLVVARIVNLSPGTARHWSPPRLRGSKGASWTPRASTKRRFNQPGNKVSSRTKLSRMKLLRGSTLRAASRRSPTPICETPATAISAGVRLARCDSSINATR